MKNILFLCSLYFSGLVASAYHIPAAVNFKPLNYGLASLQGQRPYQEDRAIVERINNSYTLAAVFDGHRNDAAADFLAKNFPHIIYQQLTNQLNKNLSRSSILNALNKSFHDANHLLSEYLQKQSIMSGSTGAVALIRHNELYIAYVGDSRIVHSNGTALTKDHKFNNPTEKARIFAFNQDKPAILDAIAKNGFIYLPSLSLDGDGVAMTRAFGDFNLEATGLIVEPDMSSRTMKSGEFIIIASDGIWDVLSDKEAAEFVKDRILQRISLDRIAEELCIYAAFHTWPVEQQQSLGFIKSWKHALRSLITLLPEKEDNINYYGFRRARRPFPITDFVDPKSGHDNQTVVIVLF